MRISFNGLYSPYINEETPVSDSYLSIRNVDDNTQSPGIWYNFPTPESEIYYEYLAEFHNIDLVPLINALASQLYLQCVPVPNPPGVNFLYSTDTVGWSSTGYENDSPRQMNWGLNILDPDSYIADGPSILTDTEYLIQGRVTVLTFDEETFVLEHELKVDGVSIGTVSGTPPSGITEIHAILLNAAGQGPGSSGCETRYKHVKVGSSWGGSDIFNADYGSGEITSLPGPWSNYYVADPVDYPGGSISIES